MVKRTNCDLRIQPSLSWAGHVESVVCRLVIAIVLKCTVVSDSVLVPFKSSFREICI